MEVFNKEDVYDTEIAPLVDKLVSICKEHGIPMLTSFTYENCEKRGAGRCTVHINNDANREDDVHGKAYITIRADS